MANEEANAKMADDEKRTRDDLEDRLREEKALAEQQAAHEDEEDDADFTDPLFDFDIEDVYNGSEEGRGKEMDVGPNAEGANAEVANVKDTNTEVPNAKGEFEPSKRTYGKKSKTSSCEPQSDEVENETAFVAENAEDDAEDAKDEAEDINDEAGDSKDAAEEEEDERMKRIEETIARLREERKKPRKPSTAKDIKVDLSKSKGWLATLRQEQEKANAAKQNKGNDEGLFEDEAEEESDIDDGVGNYGDASDMFGRSDGKNDEDDEIGMRVTKEDIAAVVDDLSEDEGEGNEAELHGQMVMADDAVKLGKIARAVRKHKFRSKRSNLRSGFSRLDDFMDDDSDDEFTEEEIDEEELYLEKLREAKEAKEKEIEALRKATENQEGDAKREAEEALEQKEEAMRMLERQVMERTLYEHRKTQATFIEKDEDAKAILGLVMRTSLASQSQPALDGEATSEHVGDASKEDARAETGGVNIVSQIVNSVSSSLHARKRKRKHVPALDDYVQAPHLCRTIARRPQAAQATCAQVANLGALAKRFVFTNTGNENSNLNGGLDESSRVAMPAFDAPKSRGGDQHTMLHTAPRSTRSPPFHSLVQ